MSNYGSPHRKNSATVITVSAPKLAYVKAVQGKPMECRQCGHRFKEDDEAVAKWNGRYTQYYCLNPCATRLLIVVI